MTKAVVAALAIASLFAFACSSSDSSGAAGPDASDSTADDATKASRDGGVDAAPALDASLPPLPPAFTECTTCMQTTCEPEIAACDADAYCVQLIACALESGCLAGDGSGCVSQCASTLGLTPKQVAQETKLLEAMATSCASCLSECPKPDAGADAGP